MHKANQSVLTLFHGTRVGIVAAYRIRNSSEIQVVLKVPPSSVPTYMAAVGLNSNHPDKTHCTMSTLSHLNPISGDREEFERVVASMLPPIQPEKEYRGHRGGKR